MLILLFSSLVIGFIHTLLGPDHYIPFVVLAKTRNWSLLKTLVITLVCGIGHILSAIILGAIVIFFGFTLSELNFIESFRGEIAVWLLIGFGFAYFIWGVRSAIKNRKHSHFHFHADGLSHVHYHSHSNEHAHIHTKKGRELTPWVLFIIFILGPCEPLIPLIMYPAIQKSLLNTILVAVAFGLSTLVTMIVMVFVFTYSAKRLLNFSLFERFGCAMAGIIICSSGLAIRFLGV